MQRALNDKCSTRGLSRDRLFKADSDGALSFDGRVWFVPDSSVDLTLEYNLNCFYR